MCDGRQSIGADIFAALNISSHLQNIYFSFIKRKVIAHAVISIIYYFAPVLCICLVESIALSATGLSACSSSASNDALLRWRLNNRA